jgi:hypothetical protein
MITPWRVSAAAAALVAVAGCNGVIANEALPGTSVTFEENFSNNVIEKVDILFDIDNSASMGDKQNYLKAAIPDLVDRIVNPNCVDPLTGASVGASTSGSCRQFPGTRPELTAVHDLHLGIISSSLGPRGGDSCDPQANAPMPFDNVLAHNDDQAHLLNRSQAFMGSPASAVSEGTVADASQPDPFLYYFPTAQNAWNAPGAGPKVQATNQVVADFADLVGGTGTYGCALQSPLESWYRFLVQPDPYAGIVVNGGKASWSGVDRTILQQRHDFLRPDSLVIVVVVSGDDDREVDVRSVGGLGYQWLSSAFNPPRGTSACTTDPSSPACKPCTEPGTTGDPRCQLGSYSTPGDGGHDLATRFVHMKEKYGVDPQFPVQRYVEGLTSPTVPDRGAEYPPGAVSYVGTKDCQNPLFAGALPDGSRTDAATLCHAQPGLRTRYGVFYVHIGGVPHELLHFTPGNPYASALRGTDWVSILGRDPLHHDLSGIDPHMIESDQPRPGIPPPGSANDADPISGHDWITGGGVPASLEYACTFPLPDVQGNSSARDCAQVQNADFCDCPRAAGSVDPSRLPPVCDTGTVTLQTGAKAYPTIRELLVAKLVGAQGIVSSICPQHVAEIAPGDPLYGYRPAFDAIVDRLRVGLVSVCLLEALPLDPGSGQAPCTMLVELPPAAGGTCAHPTCDPSLGLSVPPRDVLEPYCKSLEQQYAAAVAQTDAGGLLRDPARQSVCQLRQLTLSANPGDFQGGTCMASAEPGWCYVAGVAAGHCHQAAFFAGTFPLDNVVGHIVCSSR